MTSNRTSVPRMMRTTTNTPPATPPANVAMLLAVLGEICVNIIYGWQSICVQNKIYSFKQSSRAGSGCQRPELLQVAVIS